MDKHSHFDCFINELIQISTNKPRKIFDICILEQRDLLEILCFYRDYGHMDWFGCTGAIGIYNKYEYIYNYKKSDELVYKFMSEYTL